MIDTRDKAALEAVITYMDKLAGGIARHGDDDHCAALASAVATFARRHRDEPAMQDDSTFLMGLLAIAVQGAGHFLGAQKGRTEHDMREVSAACISLITGFGQGLLASAGIEGHVEARPLTGDAHRAPVQ